MGTIWHDHGNHYTLEIDGSLTRCVACGRPKEYSKARKWCCHQCPPRVVAAKEGASKRMEGPRLQRNTYARRLQDGFEIMHAAYGGD